MKLVESPECAREEGEMMPSTLCLNVQANVMTTLQEMCEQSLTPDSLLPIMLRSADGWDQVAAFVALTMRPKTEIEWEQQTRPIAAATQHPMVGPRNPPPCLLLAI